MAIHLLQRNFFGDPSDAGNLISADQANILLNEWVTNDRLRLHMRQVAAVMKAWALEKENADEKTALKWEWPNFCISSRPQSKANQKQWSF